MSYNGNPSLNEIWFSDADIYTLQRIYGLEKNLINNGNASFSISGIVAVSNTLSINEDISDPDNTGTLSYSWQTSSDNLNWTVVGTNSTYTVGVSEQGKSLRAVISYQDGKGFNETVTTSSSTISSPTALSNLEALLYIASNPDLIGAFGTNTDAAKIHYLTNGYAEGRSLTSFSAANYLAKYSDLAAAFGGNETLALKHYIQSGYAEGRTDSVTGSGSGGVSTLTDFQALNYIASNADLIGAFGINIDAAKSHYTNNGISEGRSLTTFSAANYLAKYSDLAAAFGGNETLALKHYIQSGYAEGRTDSVTGSGSGSGSGLTPSSPTALSDFEALNYIASYSDLISIFGINTTAASSHYVNSGYAEGRAKDNFDEWGYLASNNDLMGAFGSNTTDAIKHYISYGKSEGRSTNIFNAESYLNNYADLRSAFGNDHTLAKKHYVESGFYEGRLF